MFQQAKAKLNTTVNGTYTLVGNPTYFESGYQVSFERPDDAYTSDLFDTLVIGLCARLGSVVYIGVWDGVKEISFHTEDRDEAEAVAVKYNQDAIWDWAKGCAIMLK